MTTALEHSSSEGVPRLLNLPTNPNQRWQHTLVGFIAGLLVATLLLHSFSSSGGYLPPGEICGQNVTTTVVETFSTESGSLPIGYLYPSYLAQEKGQSQLSPPPATLGLDGRAIQRGIHSHGDPARLRRFITKLQEGQPTVVAAIGASVMAGHGASWGEGMSRTYPDIFMNIIDWMGSAFPDGNIKAINAAMGATTSTFHDSCAEVLIPEDADLVIMEEAIAMFDCDDFEACNAAKVLAIERLVRKVLNMKNLPAIVALNHYTYNRSMGVYQDEMENQVNALASYYGIPILSIRAAAFHKMVKGEKGFQVDKFAKELENRPIAGRKPEDAFYWDRVHPYGPSGARFMSDLVIALLEMTTWGLQGAPFVAAEAAAVGEALPPPMMRNNYESKSVACLFHDILQGSAVERQGFTWRSEAPTALNPADQKWGWIGMNPGDWITFKMDTRLPAPYTSEHLSKVGIGYLASYQNMGKAQLSCVQNCECKVKDIDGHWAPTVSLVQIYNLRVTQHEECYIKVRILSSTNSGGHKVKISALTTFA